MIDPFTSNLLAWFENNARTLPWKNTRDPYIIWISEIILQQTRVDQGTPYFLRFIEKFPDVFSLAKASEDEVMKYWEGLGYYSRARNLHFSAKYIVNEYQGIFPNNYPSILNLKGIGPYTAAAISSFAFDLPHAVVDGNVYRVLTRYYGIQEPIDKPKVKKEIGLIAYALMPKKNAATFNQAMMDFGATVCTPDKPKCLICPMQDCCMAFQQELTKKIPYKRKKTIKKSRFLHYIFIQENNHFYIRKRNKGIWKGLYELPGTELSGPGKIESFNNEKVDYIHKKEHLLTHQKLHIYFYKQSFYPGNHWDEYTRIKVTDRDKFSYPKPILDQIMDLF